MHRIVILGGGFGGLKTALELEKRSARFGDYEIVLVDRRAEHVYTPLLYEVATGFLQEKGSLHRGELRKGICISFKEFVSLIGSKHLRFQHAEVTGIDAEAKNVLLKDGAALAYDQLVVALGSEPAFYGIPGLKEHALPLKNVQDAFAIRERIYDQLARYRRGETKVIQLFVGGAGATGVEIAAEAANFFGVLQNGDVLREGDWSVTLVDAAPKILMALTDEMRAQAEQRLQELGVTVMTSAKMTEVMTSSIACETAEGKKTFSADVIVWCGGIQPNTLLQEFDLAKGPKGHLDVDAQFRVKESKQIFALGDCAQIVASNGFVPALAQAAVEEAVIVAENVCREATGEALIAWNPPAVWPSLIPLGGAFAVGKIGPLRLHGWIAYQLRRLVDLRYWMQTLPFKQAFLVWRGGAKTYVKNDAL